MFDSLVSTADAARTPSQRVRAFARVENAACARRLAGMYDMLAAAYAASGSAERDQWRFDNWAAVCAIIGTAHEVTSGVASGLLMDAEALAERLPRIAAVFSTGRIAYRLVHVICTRTRMVKDPAALAAVDTELAAVFAATGAISVEVAHTTIDACVLRHDPHALRRTVNRARSRKVDVCTEDGAVHVEAVLDVIDGKAFDQRVDALARTVCPRDPRDLDTRRSAAMGAMGYGWDRLPCLCEHPDCPAAAIPAVGGIVVHLVADQSALDGTDTTDRPDPVPPTGPEPPTDPDPTHTDIDWGDEEPPDQEEQAWDDHADPDPGDPEPVQPAPAPTTGESDSAPTESANDTSDSANPTGAPTGDLTAQRRALCQPPPPPLPLAQWLNSVPDPGQYCPAAPGVILGGGVVPAPVIAQAAMYATIRQLVHPGHAPPEPGYRPSRRLARYIRCRDLTCRYPGCTKSATVCDIDHVIAYPYGKTQAANLACLCREHHLAKTFWSGFSVILHPDGTMIWTTPDGHQITTHPGSRLLFPQLCTPAAPAVITSTPPPKHTAGLTMPKRKLTRADARQRAIDDERRRNTEWAEQHLRDQIPPF